METVELKAKNNHTESHITVHRVLARSYSFFLFLFMLGVLLEFIFPIKIFKDDLILQIGLIILMLASLLIFWAQNTSRNIAQHNITKETFLGGPYSFTRSPTHWGLFFLILGFGIMSNSFFIILFVIVSMIVAKLVFLKQEEAILANKYGAPYIEYKKLVRI
jgi:protein-S-isoprenylcysteine O-methyltransferase Ste14